ncbi:MAG: methyl-accepting chemotaxis protein [Peptococcaceae bacterium]|nr:methyl-accepting chemotaxis protein [Peptococcaceae bacterium]
MRITLEQLETAKELLSYLANLFSGGVILAAYDREKLTWKASSKEFDIPQIQPELPLQVGDAAAVCMQSKKAEQQKIPGHIYGTRLLIEAQPIYDGQDVVGSFQVILPKKHPITRSFEKFAPLIADMFPEGVFIYMTDLEKIEKRCASEKFDIPGLVVGTPIRDCIIAEKAIRSNQLETQEVDASVYGIPVTVSSNPCYDIDMQVIETFNLVMPQQTAVDLRNMATNLAKGIEEISAAIEQLASSASQINTNEKNLNANILSVEQHADNISNVLTFIRQIADQTKMLGLNAAIEAARAGDAGRGFGVVATEIRKLSDESKLTVTNIHDIILKIKNETAQTAKNSAFNLQASEEQAAATQEITANIEELRAMAETLYQLSLKK